MSWRCGKCGEVDGKIDNRVNAVCHHCGKPLCQDHRIEILDEVFSSDCKAYHCEECKKNFHPRAKPVGLRTAI